MDNRTTEIRYLVSGAYVTENVTGTNTPAAINAIKARYGGQDVQINRITHRPPPPSPSSDNRDSQR